MNIYLPFYQKSHFFITEKTYRTNETLQIIFDASPPYYLPFFSPLATVNVLLMFSNLKYASKVLLKPIINVLLMLSLIIST